MDEMSWRARLARNNINILNVDDERWYYEFMYHPAPHSTKWSKTFFCPNQTTAPNTDPFSFDQVAPLILRQVATLRRELEDTDDNGGKR